MRVNESNQEWWPQYFHILGRWERSFGPNYTRLLTPLKKLVLGCAILGTAIYLQSGDNVLCNDSKEATVSIYKLELMLLLLGAGVFCRRIVDLEDRRVLLLVIHQHRSQFGAGDFRYTFQRDLRNLRSLTFASLTQIISVRLIWRFLGSRPNSGHSNRGFQHVITR
jgi:hypothetical protein